MTREPRLSNLRAGISRMLVLRWIVPPFHHIKAILCPNFWLNWAHQIQLLTGGNPKHEREISSSGN